MSARRLVLSVLALVIGLSVFASAPALAAPPEAPETKAASEVGASTVKLNGVLNPNQVGEVGSYEFLYRKSGTVCVGENATVATAANGLSPEPVSQVVTGLVPGSTYTVCLRAINGAAESILGNPVSFTTLAIPPIVAEEFVTGVSSEAATLHGQVNPGGGDTTYRFEYGPTTSYGKVFSGDAGRGLEAAPVSVHIQNLTSGVIYHYRLVASNEVEEVAGADHTFTTQSAGGSLVLPDGREWELVSPPDKEGAEVENFIAYLGGVMQVAEDGEAVTYIANVPVGSDQQSSPLENQILSKRGPDGWSSQDLSTPHARGSVEEWGERAEKYGYGGIPRIIEMAEYDAFSPDLSLAYDEPESATQLAPPAPPPTYYGSGAAVEYSGGYVRDNETGTFTLTALSAKQWYAEQVASSQPSPVCDAASSPVGGVPGQEGVEAVSRDGCYVYFNSEGGIGPLNVAHYNGSEWMTTFIANGSGAGNPELKGDGSESLEVSPNGRYLAFMSTHSLTGYDNIDVNSPPGRPSFDEEVYLYDAAANRLSCASCDPTGARPAGQLDSLRAGSYLGGGNLQVDIRGVWAEGARHQLAGLLPPRFVVQNNTQQTIIQPRYVTDTGELFFQSPVALVPQDVTGTEDVYEFRPKGADGCEAGAGCVALISSGTSTNESVLIGASANGSDVFFFTKGRLASGDVDNLSDVYDAHVCSASVPCAVSPPVLLQPCETSDACKAPPTPQAAIFGAPPSATFAGAGNVTGGQGVPSSKAKGKKGVGCGKGRKLVHGKCVKRKKAKGSVRKSINGKGRK